MYTLQCKLYLWFVLTFGLGTTLSSPCVQDNICGTRDQIWVGHIESKTPYPLYYHLFFYLLVCLLILDLGSHLAILKAYY